MKQNQVNYTVIKRYTCILFALWQLLAGSSQVFAANGQESLLAGELLSMSLEEMMNIKISTAGKKAERIADIPASAVIITRKDIETYGYMTLEEILENVPGMYVIDDLGPYRKTFGVRGFYAGYPRNIIFLVNGVPQTDGVFDYNVMANFSIPVEAIDRIEVVRGPMSVMYGQGAFFGAINIITNDFSDETNVASLSYGNMSGKAAAKTTGSHGAFDYSFSAGYYYTEGADHALADMVSDMGSLSFWGITGSNDDTDGRLERDAVNFIFSGKYRQFYTDVMVNHSTDDTYIYAPSVGDGSAYHRDSAKIALGWENKVTDDLKIDARFTYHHFDFTLDNDTTNAAFTGADVGETGGEADMYEFEVDAFYDVNDAFNITTGLYHKMINDPAFRADINLFNLHYNDTTRDDIKLWAAFTRLNYRPVEKLRLVGGIRLEQMQDYTMIHHDQAGNTTLVETYDKDDVEFISSLAAIYSFNDENILKFLYGEAIARPSFFQNRDQMLDGFANLSAEEIRTFEVNYIATPVPNVTLNFSLFHNILDNLIIRTVQQTATTTVEYNANSGKLVTNGAELSVRVKPFDNLFADVSLTYQDTTDERPGYENREVAYSPHFLGYAKLSCQVTENVIFSLTGTYVDGMETAWDETLNSGAGGRIGTAVDDHFLVGANLRINNLFDTGLYMNIRGANILDEHYHYPTYVTNTRFDKGTLGAPAEVLVTLGVKF